MQIITDLGLASSEKIEQHREIWTTFGRALAQARDIRPDNAQGIAGTYIQACEALTWLLSADAHLYLEQIKCAPVLSRALILIKYEELHKRIGEAAKQSQAGRDWMRTAGAYDHLSRFVSEIRTFLAARDTITV